MKPSFLFVYFVLYLVALIALLPAASGGGLPCGDVAIAFSDLYSAPITLRTPPVVRIQIPRVRTGKQTYYSLTNPTSISVFPNGLITAEEFKGITYTVTSSNNAAQITCITDEQTGAGTISYTFNQAGTYRYSIVAKVKRRLPDNLPKCVREQLEYLQGKQLESKTEFEVVVEYKEIPLPC